MLLRNLLSILFLVPLYQGHLVAARSTRSLVKGGRRIPSPPRHALELKNGQDSKNGQNSKNGHDSSVEIQTESPDPPLASLTQTSPISPSPSSAPALKSKNGHDPSVEIQTETTDPPLGHSRDLRSFSATVEGEIDDESDVVSTLEMFLFSKLSEEMESLEWVLLGSSSSEGGGEGGTIFFLSGEAIFLNHVVIPTVARVHTAQREALNIVPLGEFVKNHGFDWVITSISFDGMDNEGVNTDEKENMFGIVDMVNVEDQEKKSHAGLIVVLVLFALFACVFSGAIVLRRRIISPKRRSEVDPSLAMDTKTAKALSTQTELLTETQTQTPTQMTKNEVTTKSWAHVFHLSTEGIEQNKSEPVRNLVPVLEKTETVILKEVKQVQNQDEDCDNRSDYIQNRLYSLPSMEEGEELLVDLGDVLPSSDEYTIFNQPDTNARSMMGLSLGEDLDERDLSDELYY